LILVLDEWANFDDDRFRYLALEEGASLAIPAEFAQIPPNDVGRGRGNPAAFGETAVTDNWEITVLETVRGDAAEAMVQEADEYYEPPEEGFEYVLARVRARNIGTEDYADWVDSSNFGIIGDSHVVHKSPWLVVPEPDLDYHTYPGADVEGWVSLQAAEGEGNLILVLSDLGDYDDDRFRYMALEEGASLTIPPELAQITPNDVGLDRENPAAFGETAVMDNWEISVLEVVRGEAAAAMAQEADEFFNDPPEEGFEYVLVRVRARNIGTEDVADWVDSSNFGIVGDQNVVYYTPWLVVPAPQFDYLIHPGGDVEGWVSLQAAEGESGLVMSFESYGFSEDSQRFFALE
jgi:hypothetical protein